MVQATEPRKWSNLATCGTLDGWPTCGRVLSESQVRSIFVIVANVLSYEEPEMPLIEDDYMVQQVSPTTADPPLRNSVLPGTAKGCLCGRLPMSLAAETTSFPNLES
jgi:hypothetical protein